MICIVCHFEIDPDDVEVRMSREKCVCLGCFHRDGWNRKVMSAELKRELELLLAAG